MVSITSLVWLLNPWDCKRDKRYFDLRLQPGCDRTWFRLIPIIQSSDHPDLENSHLQSNMNFLIHAGSIGPALAHCSGQHWVQLGLVGHPLLSTLALLPRSIENTNRSSRPPGQFKLAALVLASWSIGVEVAHNARTLLPLSADSTSIGRHAIITNDMRLLPLRRES